QQGVAEPERPHPPRSIILDYDVARLRQPLERSPSVCVLQVEDQAALAAIDRVEGRTLGGDGADHATSRIAIGWLDLDDIRAEVGQEHRAIRASHELRDVQDPKAFKGARRGRITLWITHCQGLGLRAQANVE